MTARLTQALGKVLRDGSPKARGTQALVKVLRDGSPKARGTQTLVKVLRSTAVQTDMWFTFNVTAGVQYYVKVTSVSGPYPTVNVYTGPDCASASLEFSDTNITPCNTFTKGSDTICFIHVFATLFGSSTFTIRVGTGSCPP